MTVRLDRDGFVAFANPEWVRMKSDFDGVVTFPAKGRWPFCDNEHNVAARVSRVSIYEGGNCVFAADWIGEE